jgi:hypothetical protein
VRRAVLAFVLLVAVAGCGSSYHSSDGAKIVNFTLESRDVGRTLHELLVVPACHGATLLVPFFDELRALGSHAPQVLLLDAGDHSYWHDRADGRWGTMVLREAIPAGLARNSAYWHAHVAQYLRFYADACG